MRILYAIPTLLLAFSAGAQNDLKSYQWRDHLPYNQAFSITNQGNKIIAAGNECVFAYNKDQGSYERMNKVYGYSDIEPVIVKNNPNNDALVIVYKNSNIDILKNGVITNVSDLLRKENIGNKTVNDVSFDGPFAYLSCGFGIVVINTESFEIKDTYIIGPNASNLFVYQVALSNTSIFAATKSGLYQAPLSSSNLSSFTSWSKVTGVPNGAYNGVVYFNNNIIACYSKNITSGANMQDTLFQFNGTTWSKYMGKPYAWSGVTYTIAKLIVSADGTQLLTPDQWGFESFDVLGNRKAQIWNFNMGWTQVLDIIPDPSEVNVYWAATATNGLIKAVSKAGQSNADTVFKYSINGPPNTGISNIQIKEGKIVVAPSYMGFDMFNNYLQNAIYYFQGNTWKEAAFNPMPTDTIIDLNSVAFDNNDENHYYAGSWWNGLLEFTNDAKVNRWSCENTNNLLHPTDYTTSTMTRVGGIATDQDNNVWIGMGETQHLLSVKKSDGTFASLDFTAINGVAQTPRVSHVMVDSSKQVWAVAYGLGLFLYKHDGSFTQPNASNAKKITNVTGKGGLPSNEVICIAEDKNADIWVGTDKGIYVFYNPESIFDQASGWDAQPIYIEQDGKTQLLLQTDEVMCIAVDGANNKWCGTKNSGLYCFSSDGQKQLYHFTKDNSPLFSNTIIDVTVNPKTGEVFIGTDKGILSFQNTILEGFESFNKEDVYVYPNPIKPGYDGPVLIHGMISGATVKILDAAGNFVYETTSKGGQAQWDAKNFKGQRVASGIYLVMSSTTDGQQRIMTKILLQN